MRTLTLAGALTITVLMACAGAPAARACSNRSAADHCYTLALLGSDGRSGGFAGTTVRIQSDCLRVADTTRDFVTDEVWDGVAGGRYWTEAGEAYGAPQGARSYFFWAQMRPDHGYFEHDATSGPAMGVGYPDRIRYLGRGAWRIDVAGMRAVAGDLAGPATLLEVGTETTSNATAVSGRASRLSYYAAGGGLQPSWRAGALASFPSGWGYERWIRADRSVRDGHRGCVPIQARAARRPRRHPRARRGKEGGVRARSAGAFALTAAQLRATLLPLAAANGDASPTVVHVVRTTRALALVLADPGSTILGAPGGTPAAVDPAYLVAAEGTFTGGAAKVLPGAAAPTGSVLTAVIEARTGRITDWGISSALPGLGTVGVVRSLVGGLF